MKFSILALVAAAFLAPLVAAEDPIYSTPEPYTEGKELEFVKFLHPLPNEHVKEYIFVNYIVYRYESLNIQLSLYDKQNNKYYLITSNAPIKLQNGGDSYEYQLKFEIRKDYRWGGELQFTISEKYIKDHQEGFKTIYYPIYIDGETYDGGKPVSHYGSGGYDDGMYHPDPKYDDGMYHPDPKYDDGKYHPDPKYNDGKYHHDSEYEDDDGQYHPDPKYDDGMYHPDPKYDDGKYHPDPKYNDGKYHHDSEYEDDDGQYHPDPKYDDGMYHPDPKYDDGKYHPDPKYNDGKYHGNDHHHSNGHQH